MLSNMSMAKNTKMTGINSNLSKMLGIFSLKSVGAIDGGDAAMPSNDAIPKMRFAIAEAKIPIKNCAFYFAWL